ncbi:MAG: hypothetical protein MSG64_10980 [Pyrinomonadaceae bacterium MAG19_C2-C3]|nr:hypothetical protein [Pyrinomonadaceae bacterium MAG19_C2-C3]
MTNETQPTGRSVPSVPAIERQTSDHTQDRNDVENAVDPDTKNRGDIGATENNTNRTATGEDWLMTRTRTLREFFKLNEDDSLITTEDDEAQLEVTRKSADYLETFNLEWHVLPSDNVLPMNDAYFARMYPNARRDFTQRHEHGGSYREALTEGHRHQHQGRIIAVETTNKPRYLPGNRQYYGTHYGLDQTFDPFAAYMGRAGLMSGTRYAHDYQAIQNFLRVVNEDWQRSGHLPRGFRFDICPPLVFNLIGTVFHTEWSESESLELGFYTDEQGNAEVFAVGCNGKGDYSYLNEVELETDWELLGFRLALIPE